MGDMGDTFRQMKKDNQARRENQMAYNMEVLNKSDIDYDVHNKGIQINIKKVAFYPSTNKWVFGGKTYHGNAHSFLDWLKKKGMI